MRLSEDRINAIAGKIAQQLLRKGMAKAKAGPRQLAAWIEKPIMEDLEREEQIDAEAAALIRGLSNPPPEGSMDYQILLRKKKEEISRRRGYTIG